MQRVFAIVHLDDMCHRIEPRLIQLVVGAMRGVADVAVDAEAAVVRVLIDQEVVGLPDIVHALEDAGYRAVSVALRTGAATFVSDARDELRLRPFTHRAFIDTPARGH